MSEEQYDPQMRYTEPETKVIYNNVPFKDMAWSDEHKNIFKAWATAKKEMPITVVKDATNPHFRSKYSTLDASLEVGIPVFAKHGISVIQMPTDDQLLNLMTHESGEWIAFRYRMQIKEQTAQGRGSALTYARRYCFQSLAGLAPGDDDDAESSMQRDQKDSKPKSTRSKASKPKTDSPAQTPSEKAKEWSETSKAFEDEMKESKAFDHKSVPFEVDTPPAGDPPAQYVPDGIAKILGSQIPRQTTVESLDGLTIRVKNEKNITRDDREYLESLISKQKKELNA